MPRLTKKEYINLLKKLVVFLIFIFVIFQFTNYVITNDYVQGVVARFGNVGIFMISVLSGFNIIVPVPVIAFMPIFISAGFGLLTTIFIITAGMTIGDSLGYAIGRLGRRVVLYDSGRKKQFYEKLKHYQEKSPHIPMIILFFYAAFVPLPNELIIIPLGFLGYRFINILPILFAGNIIFNTLIALGIIKIFDIL